MLHCPLGVADVAHREAQSGIRLIVSISFKIIMSVYFFMPLPRPLTLVDSKVLVSRAIFSRACPHPYLCYHCLRHGFPYLGFRIYYFLKHKSGNTRVAQKALLPCICLSLYLWFPDLTIFHFLMVWPYSVRGEPKIQAMPGSALLRFSYIIIL